MRRETKSPAEAGSQKAVAAKILFSKPPRRPREAVDAPVVPVLMVSMFVRGAPDAAKETVDVAKLQEKYAGSFPQEKLTAPVRPPCAVIVRVTFPEPWNGMIRLVGLTVVVNPGVAIVSVKGADVLPLNCASPPYTAWIMAVPGALKEVVSVATPLANVPVPIDAVPL